MNGFQQFTGEGGCSSMVKVHGNVLPARENLFRLLVQPRVYCLAILVKDMSDFGNSLNFGPENAKMWQVLSRKRQIMALMM